MYAPRGPANVTPAVLESTYDIKGVRPAGTTANKQAVAEFQGQFMNSTDLAALFRSYVSDYEVGTDDVVYKWVGEHKENSGGSRRRDCHSADTTSAFSRCFNRHGEGVSAK